MHATPKITAAGARNAAGYTTTVAPGSRFVLAGTAIGPEEAVTNETYPLQTQLGGVSVRVTVEGTTVDAWVLSAKSQSVIALLPSSVPAGAGTVTLTFNEESVETSIQVAPRAAALFATGTFGSGQASAITTDGTPVALNAAARPGQSLRLRATGFGAAPQGSDEGGAAVTQDFDASEFEVRVGNEVATVLSAKRSETAGVDELVIEIPATAMEGCFVPVALKSAGRWSNFVTLPVAANSATCSSSRFSTAGLEQIYANGEGRIGSVELQRVGISAEQAEVVTDTISGSFEKVKSDDLAFLTAANYDLPAGACTVFRFEDLGNDDDGGDGGEMIPVQGPVSTPLAAGRLKLNGPKGLKDLGDVTGAFSVELGSGLNISLPPGVPSLPSNLYLEPGAYTLTGEGGEDVGPFTTEVQFNPAQWSNGGSIRGVDRAANLRLTWTGGAANDIVMAIGGSASESQKVYAGFYCVAKASAAELTVPSYILENLPASEDDSAGLLSLMSVSGSKTFDARGLDLGLISTSRMTSRTVRYQ